MYHAKSLQVAATFLPFNCPLTNHISHSYVRNHLEPKIVNQMVTSVTLTPEPTQDTARKEEKPKKMPKQM